ncbi:MAG: cupredoxin domain-containing protein, partial [Nitrososphaerota archaeon]
GLYVGVDHAMADVVKGGAFAVMASENSTATDHPEGTCVPAKGEGVVCAEQPAETESAAEGETEAEAEGETQGENGNGDGAIGAGDEGNGNGESEVTQNATMLNTSSSNMTGNGTMITGNSTAAGNQTASSGTEVIIAQGSSAPTAAQFYTPPTLTVPTGATVTWKNADSTLHTVTSGSAEGGESGTEFDSSYLAAGKTFQWTFPTAGTFDYYCTLHPFMKGQVVVN